MRRALAEQVAEKERLAYAGKVAGNMPDPHSVVQNGHPLVMPMQPMQPMQPVQHAMPGMQGMQGMPLQGNAVQPGFSPVQQGASQPPPAGVDGLGAAGDAVQMERRKKWLDLLQSRPGLQHA